jgi:hypothetical protein
VSAVLMTPADALTVWDRGYELWIWPQQTRVRRDGMLLGRDASGTGCFWVPHGRQPARDKSTGTEVSTLLFAAMADPP